MTSVPSTLPADDAAAAAPSLLSDYAALTKVRLSALVVVTAAVGYLVGASPVVWSVLLATLVGTALAAGSAAVLNQLWEVDRDARMERTRGRPLPAGRIGRAHALLLGVALGYAGVTVLALWTNWTAAGLALGNIVLYVLVYTPLKARTTLNTLVGAVCGAVPPLIGWAAATGGLGGAGWVLAVLLFVWQLPHFLALAWMYREEYERGGFRMLPVVDRSGRVTAETILLTSLMLVPLGLMVTLSGLAGWVFAAAATALALWMLVVAWRMVRERTDRHARTVFLASIAYLPLLMLVMVLNRGTALGLTPAAAIVDLGPDPRPRDVSGVVQLPTVEARAPGEDARTP